MYEVCGQLILVFVRRIPNILTDIARFLDQLDLVQGLFEPPFVQVFVAHAGIVAVHEGRVVALPYPLCQFIPLQLPLALSFPHGLAAVTSGWSGFS